MPVIPFIQRDGVSPFRDLRINARLTAPRSLSQPTTSFIVSGRLGIHHAPLTSLTTSMNRCLNGHARFRLAPAPVVPVSTTTRQHDKSPSALYSSISSAGCPATPHEEQRLFKDLVIRFITYRLYSIVKEQRAARPLGRQPSAACSRQSPNACC